MFFKVSLTFVDTKSSNWVGQCTHDIQTYCCGPFFVLVHQNRRARNSLNYAGTTRWVCFWYLLGVFFIMSVFMFQMNICQSSELYCTSEQVVHHLLHSLWHGKITFIWPSRCPTFSPWTSTKYCCLCDHFNEKTLSYNTILLDLHWLPISSRIIYKLMLIVFRSTQ